MAKYLIQATSAAKEIKEFGKDQASGRKAALEIAMASLDAKVECMYYAFGDYDVVLIVEAPDNLSVAACNFTVGSTGLARTRTISRSP